MNKFSSNKLQLLRVFSALLFPALVVALLVGPAHTQQIDSSASVKKSNSSIAFSPATSGVKLLESILSRLHGSVQVAMAKQERRLGSIGQNQVSASDKLNASGESEAALDYKLAIKPKAQKELKAADLDSSAGAQSSGSSNIPMAQIAQTAKSIGGAKVKRGQAHYYSAPRQVANLDDSPIVKDRRTAKSDHSVAFLPPPPPVPQSCSIDQMEEAKLKDEAKKAKEEPSEQQIIAQSGSSLSLNAKTNEIGAAGNESVGKLTSKNLSTPAPSSTESPYGQYRLAMTPPTIIKGIVGAQLGANESDIYRFWMGKGKIQKEAVAGWKVFSVRSNDGRYLVQLFLSSGHVEAIRIFDNAYVLKYLGVNIGDSLAKLKQTLGEPSFIISEPNAGGGQNYVYPVNQIAFQLKKGGGGKSPGIVSMLIFNTK